MRILFADQFSEWGGAQLGLRDVMEESLQRGWSVHLLAPAGPLADYFVDRGIPVYPLPLGCYANGRKTPVDTLRFVPDMIRCGAAIRRIVRRNHIDLVVVNGPRILPATVGVGCPVVFHSHSAPGKRYASELAGWFGRLRGTSVIAVSRFAADWIRSGHADVVYNGVKDLGFIGRREGRETVRVGIIGRIAPEKGQLDFVQAAHAMVQAHPTMRFSVIGASLYSNGAYEHRIRERARGLPVEFPGWTTDIAGALHDLDVLAVPSTGIEAATRVIMEAYSAGTPVVAYPSGGIPELVRHRETGILTEEATPKALARAVMDLIADPELTARLVHNGRREWETRFRLERFQREVCDLFEKRVAVRCPPPAKAALQQAE